MAFKAIRAQDGGDAKLIGGNDYDKIADLLNGVANVDNVFIQSNWHFMGNRLRIRNQGNNANYIVQGGPLSQTRTIFLPPNLTSDDEFTTNKAVQEIENKTIDASKNNLIGVSGGSSASNRKTGLIQTPTTATGGQTGQGMLHGFFDNPTSPEPQVEGPPGGTFWRYDTGSTVDVLAGIRWPAGRAFVRGEFNPRLKMKFRTPVGGANHQLTVGFSTNSNIHPEQAISLSNQSLFIVGYRPEHTGFMIWRNGGTNANSVTPILTTTNATRGNAYRSVEIIFSNGGQRVDVEIRQVTTTGTPLQHAETFTTNVPNPTSQMFPVFQIISRNSANHPLNLYFMEYESDF